MNATSKLKRIENFRCKMQYEQRPVDPQAVIQEIKSSLKAHLTKKFKMAKTPGDIDTFKEAPNGQHSNYVKPQHYRRNVSTNGNVETETTKCHVPSSSQGLKKQCSLPPGCSASMREGYLLVQSHPIKILCPLISATKR